MAQSTKESTRDQAPTLAEGTAQESTHGGDQPHAKDGNAPGDKDSRPSVPDQTKGNPDLIKYLTLIGALLAVLVEGLAVAELLPLLTVTQYGFGLSAIAMWVLEVGDSGVEASDSGDLKGTPSKRAHVLWKLAWLSIAVTAFACSPSPWLVGAYSIVFWLFTLSEWKCRLAAMPRTGTLMHRAWRAVSTFKRIFGGRRGAHVTAAVVLAAFTAVAGTTGASVAIIAIIKKNDKGHPAKSPGGRGDETANAEGLSTTTTASTTTTNTSQNGEASTKTPPPPLWNGECNARKYREAEWAAPQINQLLETGAGLGPEEEGCVESLNTEYMSRTGFVWGKGINPQTKQTLSIVVDSPDLSPAIFLAPALTAVETLIKHYRLLGGTEKEFPRYNAGRGDYYLANTGSEGTCVIIRSRSGTSGEAPPYLILYPTVGVAWATIIKDTKQWQWPTEGSALNQRGEVVFYLTPPGATANDAVITYDPRSGEAHWKSYRYTLPEENLSPTKLERYARRYLPEAQPTR